LNWDHGSGTGSSTFNTSLVQPGSTFLLGVQLDSPVAQSGIYDWEIDMQLSFGDGSTLEGKLDGTAPVVVRDTSPYGAGWGIAGIDQLVTSPDGVMWITGAGDYRVFRDNGGTFTSPANDFGTLVQNADSSFTYTSKDKMVWNFSPPSPLGSGSDRSQSFLTSVADTHGLALKYSNGVRCCFLAS